MNFLMNNDVSCMSIAGKGNVGMYFSIFLDQVTDIGMPLGMTRFSENK